LPIDFASTMSLAKRTEKKKSPPTILKSDISEKVQTDIVEMARQALSTASLEKDIAQKIKKHVDAETGATWHCVVGTHFASSITHAAQGLFFFQLDGKSILLFKSID